jgi:hypothetical protein
MQRKLSAFTSTTATTRICNIFTTEVPGFNETKGVQKANLTSDHLVYFTIS